MFVRRKQTRYMSLLLDAIGVVYVVLILSLMILRERQSDFLAHIDIARSLEWFEWFSYSTLFPVLHVTTLVSSAALIERLVLVGLLVAALILRMMVTTTILKGSGLSAVNSRVLSLGLLAFMPLVDPRRVSEAGNLFEVSRFSGIYLGQFTPNVWHNSTTILMAPFALLAARHIYQYSEDPTRRQLQFGALFLLLSTLTKPNYVFAAVPIFVVLALWLFKTPATTSRQTLVRCAYVIAPALVITILQFLMTFLRPSSSFAGSVVFRPFAQWEAFSDNYLLSVFRSLVFPVLILVLLLLFRKSVSVALVCSWLALVVAVATFVMFVEAWPDGSLRLQGNLSWGIIPTLYILLVYSLRDWYSYYLNSEKSRAVRLANLCVLLLLAAHVTSGVGYGLLIATGKLGFAG